MVLSKGFIVIIDDEEDILDLVEYNLQKAGYETEGFLNTVNVEKILEEESVDLLIVDRNLPGVEGSLFVKKLRDKGMQTPIIFLTAKTDDKDRLEGFERGADDYVTKPFNVDELIMRIGAILKRTNPASQDIVEFRDIKINQLSKEVRVENEIVSLTRLEYRLLLEFIKNKNVVLTRDYLLETVWKDESSFQEKTVNVAIKRLKEKIDPCNTKDYIKSVRGEGYKVC